MAKYGVNYYGSSKYGLTPLLRYSVRPFEVLVSSVVATDFRKATLTWQSPNGNFTRFRLLRNQAGFSETAEDGVIIFDEFATEGNVSRSYFIDGEDNPNDIPLIPGRQVYYTVFLFTDEKIWVNAGTASAIIPGDHGAHTQIMNMLPRVFTSKEQGPLGVVDNLSTLHDFLYGVSFTHEESLTFIDLLRPRHTGYETPVSLLPAERNNVGLLAEPALPTKNQKRLIREALYMYTHKGTKNAIETYVESLTGYAPNITVSENLLLTVQDSTFYNSTGNWVFTNATAVTSDDQVPATGDNVIDTVYSCKVTATDIFTMSLGADAPVTKGVPVTAGSEYTASFKVKSPPSDGSVKITVNWCDGTGSVVDTVSSSNTAANNTWKTVSVTATAPSDAVYAVLEISSTADGQYYIDQVCMQLGDTVAYDEARAVDIFLNPVKTNFINNPSFEVNTTDSWTLDGTATLSQDVDVSDQAYSGTNSGKVTATGAWTLTSNAIPVEQGKYYTASGYVKTTADLTVTFVGRDQYGDVVVANVDEYPLGTSADWSRFIATDIIGSEETDVVTYEVVFSGDAGDFYLDCLQFETSPVATDYFDGSLPSKYGAIWAGTADNSYSYLYPSLLSKVPRLGKTLTSWLPQNTFWRLRTYAGVEYTNLTV